MSLNKNYQRINGTTDKVSDIDDRHNTAMTEIEADMTTIEAHLDSTSNPHSVTKSQVGLGNADNTSDASKPISTATQAALDDKVDKVAGKVLSSNDYTSAEKTKLSGIATGATKYPDTGEEAYTSSEKTKLAGISAGATKYPDTGENAYTDAEKTKLSGIEAGADVTDAANVAAAGAVMTETDPVFSASEAANFETGDKTKLDGIESGAEVNNISDVDATDLTDGGATTLHKHSYNNLDDKPSLGTAAAQDVEDFAPALGPDDNYVTDAEKTAIGTIGDKAAKTNVLEKDNVTSFTPDADYEPATKKYVDDSVSAAGGYTDEKAQDAVGGILNNSGNVQFTYDDATPKITASVDLSGKVDVVAGKGLSANDFTDVLKTKLDGIAAGAEVNVNADWSAVSGDSQILNKPTLGALAAKSSVDYSTTEVTNKPSLGDSASKNVGTSAGTVCAGDDARLTNSRTPTAHASNHVTGGGDTIADAVAAGNSGLMSGADKTKLNGIASGATVGADWNTNVSNKPSLGSLAAKSSVDYSTTEVTNKPTLGDSAAKNVGTTAGTVAAGDHNHSGIYDDSGAATSAVSTHAALLTGVHGLAITTGKTLTVQDNVTITGPLGTGAYATIANYAPLAAPALTGSATLDGSLHIGHDSNDTGNLISFVNGASMTITAENNLYLAADPGNAHSAGYQNIIFKTAGTERLRIAGTALTMTFADGLNMVFGTTTGTKIGTAGGASGQKIGFWNATPIVQPVLATGASKTVDNVITVLQNLGLVRQS